MWIYYFLRFQRISTLGVGIKLSLIFLSIEILLIIKYDKFFNLRLQFILDIYPVRNLTNKYYSYKYIINMKYNH